jgi:hypothetical protein
MAITISGDSPNLTSASLTTPTLTSPTFAGTPSGSIITSMTAQASTSGTSIDFTSIPSWVKRITVMFDSVSTNGTSAKIVQIGSGSVTTSGYLGTSVYTGASTGGSTYTTGIGIADGSAADNIMGTCVICLLGSNTWVASVCTGRSSNAYGFLGGARLALGGTLDRVRITTVNGTDTFDAGSINILYE